MSDLCRHLLKLETETLIRLLNSAKVNFRKQEIIFKLWQVLEIDNKELDDKLLLYGVDKGHIPKGETLTIKDRISFERNQKFYFSSDQSRIFFGDSYLINLPEVSDNFQKNEVLIDDKYKENDWELFRVIRRIPEPREVIPKTWFLYKDDEEALEEFCQRKISEEEKAELINEAAFFGSIKCFKRLLVNTAKICDNTIELACCSGNEEIVQILMENGLPLNEKCLKNAILHLNIKMSKSSIHYGPILGLTTPS